MLRKALKELENHQGDPLISIIAPMRKTFPDLKENPVILKNQAKEIKHKLEASYDDKTVKRLMDNFDKIEQSLDYENMDNGIAIFIGDNMQKVLSLPFEPKPQSIVDKSFQVRELVYSNNRIGQYFVICVSEGPTRLIEGYGKVLKEVENESFPAEFLDPGRIGRFDPRRVKRVDFEHVRDEQKKQYFREIDELVFQYMGALKMPVVLVGVKKNLSLFRSVARTDRYVTGTIEGNHVSKPLHELSDMVWPVIEQHYKKSRDNALERLEEAIGQKRYVSGIQNVWEHAVNGTVETVLVEHDYFCPAYIGEDPSKLYFDADMAQNNLRRLEDAIDDIVEYVIRNNGQVYFLSNGRLKGHDRVAAITRY